MKDWIMELCPEIAEWQAELIAEQVRAESAAERERCAKVCEEIEMNAHALWDRTADPEAQGRGIGAADCAAAIREMK